MGVMVELLADDQIAEAKATRPHWDVAGAAFVRTVELASFPQAIEAVNRIAEIAEEMNHHPDIDIRWRTLKFSVSTHSKGGITSNDVALIDRIDSVLAELSSG